MKMKLKSDSGQTLVLVALLLVVLLGAAALAVDAGSLYSERRDMQNAADAAALAGAGELCYDPTNLTAANDMAINYATVRNDADQAFPTPLISGNLRSMTVDVQKTANHFFARIFTAGSSEVTATATARCERTGSGCGTWPETVKREKFRNLGCNTVFYISLSNDACDDTTHICDNIFTAATITTEQRGWFSPTYDCNASNLANLLTGDFPPVPVRLGQCIGGQPGADLGVPGGNGGNVVEWRNEHPDHRALIPLFSCYGETVGDGCISPWDGACVRSGGCAGEYLVSGFGCMEPLELVKNYDIPKRISSAPNVKITAIRAVVRCDCTISCGTSGGLPEPGDAMIPVLVE